MLVERICFKSMTTPYISPVLSLSNGIVKGITRVWAIVIALIEVIAAIAGIISIQMLSPGRAPQQAITTQFPTPLTTQ
jgi:hypothetical protein